MRNKNPNFPQNSERRPPWRRKYLLTKNQNTWYNGFMDKEVFPIMFGTKKIKVCKKCSGFDVNELKEKFTSKDYSIGCIHKCLNKNVELKGKVFGLIKGDFVVCNTKEEFFEKLENI
jgi:hypothetical protein